MNLAQCLRAADQFCSVSQVRRQCFLDCFIVQQREHCVDDLAHALGVELAEFSINRHPAADVNSCKRWIGQILFGLFRIGLVFRCYLGRWENFEFVGGLVQS